MDRLFFCAEMIKLILTMSSSIPSTHEQVCRRGDVDLLGVLVDGGVNLRVSDDYGRTVSFVVTI
jgi:hypothetical protein